VGRARITVAEGVAAVRAATTSEAGEPGAAGPGTATDREKTALAVRDLLQVLAEAAPGNTVEVRVPPYGAVQCVEGPRHTRGTPPNVIETDAATWLALATGATTWQAAVAESRVSASGTRANLDGLLPLDWTAGE
jgi:hypothetical protein